MLSTADSWKIGVLTPHGTPGPESEFPIMAPGRFTTRVVRIRSDPDAGGTADPPTTPQALRALTVPSAVDAATAALLADRVDAAAYASTTTAYVIGRDAETTMLARISSRLGVPAVAACASAVAALRELGVGRLALVGAPWFEPEHNELGAAYFRSQGFDVVSSRSAALSRDPGSIEAVAVCDWISGHVEDEAEAIFIGGNGFRTVGAVAPLEQALGRPVLTANQVLLWALYESTGVPSAITGFGRLLAR